MRNPLNYKANTYILKLLFYKDLIHQIHVNGVNIKSAYESFGKVNACFFSRKIVKVFTARVERLVGDAVSRTSNCAWLCILCLCCTLVSLGEAKKMLNTPHFNCLLLADQPPILCHNKSHSLWPGARQPTFAMHLGYVGNLTHRAQHFLSLYIVWKEKRQNKLAYAKNSFQRQQQRSVFHVDKLCAWFKKIIFVETACNVNAQSCWRNIEFKIQKRAN